MKTEQITWSANQHAWNPSPPELGNTATLVVVFGARALIEQQAPLTALRAAYPNAQIMGCSTAGEIRGAEVLEQSMVATAIHFEHTRVCVKSMQVEETSAPPPGGPDFAGLFDQDGLVHLFVLADGLRVNGSQLAKDLAAALPPHVSITGGLAGDGPDFEQTSILHDDTARPGRIVACAFYGDRLRVGYGTQGGWDPFGIERHITRSSGNILYELDGQSALALYKKYLGERADELPAAGLLFPLEIRERDVSAGLVRTILSVNEDEQSMTFAGDVPEGFLARFMKANFDRLIDGAAHAAADARALTKPTPAQLALLVSCVGRKMVLGQRVEEEVEAVQESLYPSTTLAGFYSYGEICPFAPTGTCELHNQTMTITTLSEI